MLELEPRSSGFEFEFGAEAYAVPSLPRSRETGMKEGITE